MLHTIHESQVFSFFAISRVVLLRYSMVLFYNVPNSRNPVAKVFLFKFWSALDLAFSMALLMVFTNYLNTYISDLYFCSWSSHGCLMRFMLWGNSKMLLISWLRRRIGVHSMTLLRWAIIRCIFLQLQLIFLNCCWPFKFPWRFEPTNSPRCNLNVGENSIFYVLIFWMLIGTSCGCCLLWWYVCQLQVGHGNSSSDSRDQAVDYQRVHAFWSTRWRGPGFRALDGIVKWKEAFVLISSSIPVGFFLFEFTVFPVSLNKFE